eukprot:m.21610 g.21610  ORF g.21610 m.21610 type:complete len:137 (-) comp13476_c1_seq1:115-525(-)
MDTMEFQSIRIERTITQVSGQGEVAHGFNAPGVFQLFKQLRTNFGWKENYGKLTSSSTGVLNRRKAEEQALEFIFNMAEVFSKDLPTVQHMMAERERLKLDFGWKEKYDVLTATDDAAVKRADAEKKAEDELLRRF